MRSLLLIICALCALHVSAQIYHARKVAKGSIIPDGKGSSPAWRQADQLTDFVYPWDSAVAPPTSFAALWDGDWFYGLFRVKDDSVVTLVKSNDKMDVGGSDRVEIFLKKDDAMNPYYCLEMDADGRVLDYNAFYYRKVNYPWHWPDGQLIIKASRAADGYIVEFAISVKSLNEFGLVQDHRLQAGLFRGQHPAPGTPRRANGWVDLRWISWIRPKSNFPDFHIPSAFGTLILD
ncbi:MAG TPA: carbohydrate-binding family 9-like protein [Puia sp.]